MCHRLQNSILRLKQLKYQKISTLTFEFSHFSSRHNNFVES
jgi:hypothetical protein